MELDVLNRMASLKTINDDQVKVAATSLTQFHKRRVYDGCLRRPRLRHCLL